MVSEEFIDEILDSELNQERIYDAIMNLPKIDNHIAHPQSVWFEEHWRPLFEKLEKENSKLKRIIELQKTEYNDILEPKFINDIEQLKSKLKIATNLLRSAFGWVSRYDNVGITEAEICNFLKENGE